MKITVIGSGNGGQALAGWLSIKGHSVCLWGRDKVKIEELSSIGKIELTGVLNGVGNINQITNDLQKAVDWGELILITTTANAHSEIALSISSYLKEGQVLILNPGRTGGAIEFRNTIEKTHGPKILVAEAQTLMFACRIIKNGLVNIIGIKDKVLFSAFPSSDSKKVYDIIKDILPSFIPADNILQTSLENIGAIFHPCVLLFNAATIERQNDFWFYRDMTPTIANFIEKVDSERLKVGEAYDVPLMGVNDWISYAYPGTTGINLCEKMKNNPAYYDIKSPSTLLARQITEDIPTGIIPIMELGSVAGLSLPLMQSLTEISSSLLNIDFKSIGRSLKNLGLEGLTKEEILAKLSR